MQYLMLIYNVEGDYADRTPEDLAAMFAAHGAFGQAAAEAGVMLGGAGLQPTTAATTLRVRDGERLLTDGPFAETKEQLGGYYLLDCKDLDEALSWAARIPEAQRGSVEVRPLMDLEGMRAEAGLPAEAAAS
jgi:hypothetical protein